MWSDTLRDAERTWLVAVLVWAGVSVIAGTALYALIVMRARRSALLRQFAVQCIAWGAAALLIGAIWLSNLPDRDLAGAVRLDRALWFSAGLMTTVALGGCILALVAFRRGRHLGGVGAGIALVVQGVALLVLVLQMLAITGAGL